MAILTIQCCCLLQKYVNIGYEVRPIKWAEEIIAGGRLACVVCEVTCGQKSWFYEALAIQDAFDERSYFVLMNGTIFAKSVLGNWKNEKLCTDIYT